MCVSNLMGQKLGCCHLIGLIYISTMSVPKHIMCSAKKWTLLYQELYVWCHYFLGIYHLLPFGSSKLHVFVHRFFIQAFCFVHSIIQWFVPSFPLRLHSVSFRFLYSFHSCISFHFHIITYLYNFFKDLFISSFIYFYISL